MENLNQSFETVKNEIDLTKNNRLTEIENKNEDQIKINKGLMDKIALKKKTVNLINDAPMNILKLKV